MKNLTLFFTKHGFKKWHLLNYDRQNIYLINNKGVVGVFPKILFSKILKFQFQGSFDFELIYDNYLLFRLNFMQ